LWDVESLACRHILKCFTWAPDITFSPQGHQLASVGEDGRVLVWDVENGDCLMILIGHTGYLRSIEYSLNGETLFTGCDNNIVRLWDVTSGQSRVISNIHGDFQQIIRGIDSEHVYAITWMGGTLCVWRVIDDGDRCRVIPPWVNTTGELIVSGASVQSVRGLSQLNKKLLKQRGAEGEPEYQFIEASKKVVAMASVLSKLKQPTRRGSLVISNTDQPDELAEVDD
jgi:WD40 repeat protein